MSVPIDDLQYWFDGPPRVSYPCGGDPGKKHLPVSVRDKGSVTVRCKECKFTMVMKADVYDRLLLAERSRRKK